jgi:hypothetical protein
VNLEPWATDFATPGPRYRKPRLCTFRQPDPLLLGNDRQDTDNRIFEDATRVQVLLREAFVADAASSEPVQVLEGNKHAFTRQGVERPKQNQVKFSAVRIRKHQLEFTAVACSASLAVDVLAYDLPVLLCGEFAQLDKLILCFLAFVFSADASIESNFHLSPRRPSLARM